MGVAGKQAAARAAVDLVEDGMTLGLGTGSTVEFFLEGLAERQLDVAGVPTSEATATRCAELGLRLLDPDAVEGLDLAVDGADELDHDLTLVKGGGGALLREKVVASMAARLVIVATADKLVDRLADSFALPVEVVPFAVAPTMRRIEQLGFQVVERSSGDRSPYRTDNGNAVLDCRREGGLDDPAVTDITVSMIPGVCETGLFVDLAHEALLGDDDGRVERLVPR